MYRTEEQDLIIKALLAQLIEGKQKVSVLQLSRIQTLLIIVQKVRGKKLISTVYASRRRHKLASVAGAERCTEVWNVMSLQQR